MIFAVSLLYSTFFFLILDRRVLQGRAITEEETYPKATQNDVRSNLMKLVLFPENSEAPGGQCLDGTQAGFYVRRGANPKLFVIDIKGGGACATQENCDERSESDNGSSKAWPIFMGSSTLHNPNCRQNPDFCDATAAYVPYCTGDLHLGTRTESSEESFGYEFHGRYNFMLMIDMLETEYGLGDADAVLLTGRSAGAFGALFTVDWLADRLPNAVVKAAPQVGWFTPSSLDDDMPDARIPPSNYEYFRSNTTGNDIYDEIIGDKNSTDPWLIEYAMDEQCITDNADFPPFCILTHVAYKYIKSSLFFIQPLFDGVHVIGGAPSGKDIPLNETEIFKDYVTMWGEAMYLSMDQIVQDESVHTKPHTDGLFATSCIAHAVPLNVLIDGFNWIDLLHDWFFQINELEEHHQLIESCPGGDNSLPCNEYWNECLLPEWMTGDPCIIHSKRQPCIQDSECVWYKQNGNDNGSCIGCSPFENKSDCRDVGCIWDTFGQKCYAPTPSPTTAPTPLPTISFCNSIGKKKQCKETTGCFWNRDDSIGLLQCDSCDIIEDEHYCHEKTNCGWDDVKLICT